MEVTEVKKVHKVREVRKEREVKEVSKVPEALEVPDANKEKKEWEVSKANKECEACEACEAHDAHEEHENPCQFSLRRNETPCTRELLEECKKKNVNETRIKELIALGADVNFYEKDPKNYQFYSNLMFAIMNKNKSLVEILVAAGANVNFQGSNGTPLIVAVKNNWLEIMQFLINSGADPNGETYTCYPPLWFVLDYSIAKFLIDSGANANFISHDDCNLLMIACSCGVDINLLKLFIDNGNDINQVDYYGNNALTCVCRGENEGDESDNDNESNDYYPKRKKEKNTERSYDNRTEIVKFLIESGINLNCDASKKSLIYAASNNYKSIVKILIDAGLDVNYKCEYTYITPLVNALLYGNEEVSNILINAGADINEPTLDGNTPLIMLCDIMALEEYEQETEEYRANKRSCEKNAEFLIKLGADVTLRNNCGCDALYYARRNEMKRIIGLLNPCEMYDYARACNVCKKESANNTLLLLDHTCPMCNDRVQKIIAFKCGHINCCEKCWK